MTTKTFLLLAAVLFFMDCNNPKQENKKGKIDVVSGATNDKANILAIPKDEAVNLVYDSLINNGPYYFATIENDAPRVRPIGVVMKHDGKIWFHVGKHKASYEQIQNNPNVEIVTTGSPSGKFIRITGKAACEDNKIVDEMTFKKEPGLKNMYNEQTGKSLGHFYISNGIAEFPSDSGTVIIRF